VHLRLVSLLGYSLFLLCAFLFSENRRAISRRTVFAGIALQLLLALFVLKTPAGELIFASIQKAFNAAIHASNAGATFVFGNLADGKTFYFFVTVPCTLIFLSSLMALLYYHGVMQRIVAALAWIMHRTMKLSGRESLVAAANVFVGMTEAPLFIRPYLEKLTRSEMMALMTTGLATVAGTVMAVYVGFGVNAGHLLTASIMSAPAALIIAKIVVPETQKENENSHSLSNVKVRSDAVNSFEAICIGARDGLHLSLNIIAMLIAVLSLLALCNIILAALGSMAGIENLTLQQLFSYLGYPVALLLGVTKNDALVIGELLSTKLFLTELIAYKELGTYAATLSPRTVVIATYALCGFSNIGSVAIIIGGLTTLAPSQRHTVVRLAFKALFCGTLATLSTAAIAGILT
jgi:concentrative nucleoside transporter, CNT family